MNFLDDASGVALGRFSSQDTNNKIKGIFLSPYRRGHFYRLLTLGPITPCVRGADRVPCVSWTSKFGAAFALARLLETSDESLSGSAGIGLGARCGYITWIGGSGPKL